MVLPSPPPPSAKGQRGSGGYCEIVKVPNTLKEKVGNGPAVLDEETAHRLDDLILRQRPMYLPILDDQLEELHAAISGYRDGSPLDDSGNRALFFHSHRIRGEAGMNGLSLLGAIADLLCECLDDPSTLPPERLVAFVRLHVDALLAARAANLEGLGGEAGDTLIEGLRRARSKLAG